VDFIVLLTSLDYYVRYWQYWYYWYSYDRSLKSFWFEFRTSVDRWV